MKEILIFAAGVLIGGWVDHRVSLPGLRGDDPPVYLNGGSFSSTTIGLIYGYVDDMEGCTIHAAGMNYYYQSDEAMLPNSGGVGSSHKDLCTRG
ncbi:MAG TPA: hypothetical protein VKA94_00865 [Hyphomicrobiales bacterium]|nr:hypothetical protein [Hyphomicrobiales bacterium]